MLAFNLGVEIGQLSALTVMVVLAELLIRYVPRLRQPALSYAVLVAAGVCAAAVLSATAITQPTTSATAGLGSSCEIRKRTDAYPAGGGHPLKDFYEPTEQSPAKSFGHVVGDGFVIVHYNPSLPADQLAQLRAFVTDPASGRVVGGPEPTLTQPIKAVHAYQTELVCTGFDLSALRQFTTAWFADPRSKPAE